MHTWHSKNYFNIGYFICFPAPVDFNLNDCKYKYWWCIILNYKNNSKEIKGLTLSSNAKKLISK